MDMDFDDMEFNVYKFLQVQQQPAIDPLDGHEYLTFPLGSIRHERCMKLCTMEIGGHMGIDRELLETKTEAATMREIVGLDTPGALAACHGGVFCRRISQAAAREAPRRVLHYHHPTLTRHRA
ncbi:hypothetical protein Hanom_Chr05g00395021 [Helianthus anomalus]